MRPSGVLAALAAASSAIVVAAIAMPASAYPEPSVRLGIPNPRVTAGKSFEITYSASRLPSGSVAFLERRSASGHAWSRIKRLPGIAGRSAAPAVPMGWYDYRIAVWKPSRPGALLAASPERSVYSYGNVSLETICLVAEDSSTAVLGGGCDGGAAQIGNDLFAYTATGGYAQYPAWSRFLETSRTTCRSLTLRFSGVQADANTQYLKATQAAGDPQITSTPPDTVGTLHMALNGRELVIASASSDGGYALLSGSFSCYSATGGV